MTTAIEAQGAAASAGLSNDMPTLRKGSSSEGVRLLQQLLILRYNYKDITFDAVFRDSTEAAVKDFQRHHNLTVDGVVGVQTWRQLGANIACKASP